MAKDTLLILGVAALGYYLYTKSKENKIVVPDTSVVQTNTPVQVVKPTTTLSYYSYPITYNNYNPDVKKLQSVLGVPQDGIIGAQTLAALNNKIPFNLPKFTTRISIGSSSILNTLITGIKGANIWNAIFK